MLHTHTHINIAVKIRSHVLLKRKMKKTFLKTQISIKLKNKISLTNQDKSMFKKKTYVNEDYSKMIKSHQKLLLLIQQSK